MASCPGLGRRQFAFVGRRESHHAACTEYIHPLSETTTLLKMYTFKATLHSWSELVFRMPWPANRQPKRMARWA